MRSAGSVEYDLSKCFAVRSAPSSAWTPAPPTLRQVFSTRARPGGASCCLFTATYRTGQLKSFATRCAKILAAIVTHVALVSVLVTEPLFLGRHVEVLKLARRFWCAGASCKLDAIQVFGGTGEISLEFSYAELRARQVIDSRYGDDPKNAGDRRFVLDYIRHKRPHLVTMEPLCTLWGMCVRLKYRT